MEGNEPPDRRYKTAHEGIWFRQSANGVRRYIVHYVCSGCKPNGGCHGHTETRAPGAGERDAKARRAELISKSGRGERIVTTKIRVSVFAHEWLVTQQGNLAPSTVELYRWAIDNWIVPALGRKHLNEVTTDDVARLVSKMKAEGKKAWTIRNVLTPMSRIMSHAVRRGLAPTNPVLGLDKSERPKSDQREMRILSSAEIEKLLPVLTTRWRPLISLLVFTGLRISEALALTWDDIDFDKGLIAVRRSKTSAGVRRVVLMPGLSQALREHLMASPRRQGLVFCTVDGNLLDRRYVLTHVLKPATAKAGVTEVSLHELRHTFASILIGAGFDVTFVADQLGHADPAITLRTYARLYDAEARKNEARDKLETKFGHMMGGSL